MSDVLPPPHTDDHVTLLDLVRIVAKRWRLVFFATAITAVGVVGFNLYAKFMPADAPFNLIPDYYAPEVKVRVQDPQAGPTPASSGDTGLDLIAGLAGVGSSGSSEADLAEALLRGNSLIDRVAEEMDFNGVLGESRTPKTRNRRFFKESIIVNQDSDTGIMTIKFENPDRVFAAEVLSRSLELLEDRFRELTMESVTVKKQLIEARLAQVRSEREAAERDLIEFQSIWGIVDLQTQAQSQMAEIAQIKAAILNLEFEIDTLGRVRREDDPEILRKQLELSSLREQLTYKEEGGFESDVVYIPTGDFPEVSAQYYRYKEELLIQQTLYTTLRQQYELVRIEEAETGRTFQIVEAAEIPEVKSGPSRSRMVILVTFAGFAFSVLLTFALEFLDSLKSNPTERRKLEEIKGAFRSVRKR